jgi:hypothetical protein
LRLPKIAETIVKTIGSKSSGGSHAGMRLSAFAGVLVSLSPALCAAETAGSACAQLKEPIPAASIGLPGGGATIGAADVVPPSPLTPGRTAVRAAAIAAVAARPMCRYPSYPHYRGGEPAKAESFTCMAP